MVTVPHNWSMRSEVETTLAAADGVPISAVHLPVGGADPLALAIVVVHGFTNSWRTPRVQRVIDAMHAHAAVVAIDMRGHGRSGGCTTVGDAEILDVSAAVRWARQLGYRAVATVGFSMGGSVVLRQAGLEPDRVDAVVSVSAPAFWYYRGTRVMRLVHRLIERPSGRAVLRARGVRVTAQAWSEPLPVAPVEAIGRTDIPVLVVHGTVDHYFPLEHARALHAAAVASGNQQADLWIVDGFAHAESGIDDRTLDRIGQWVRNAVAVPTTRGERT